MRWISKPLPQINADERRFKTQILTTDEHGTILIRKDEKGQLSGCSDKILSRGNAERRSLQRNFLPARQILSTVEHQTDKERARPRSEPAVSRAEHTY